MIAALDPRKHVMPPTYPFRRTMGDDTGDDINLDDYYNPSNAPPDDGTVGIGGPITVTDPIQIDTFTPYGPPVPLDYVAPPPEGYVYAADGSLQPIAGTGTPVPVSNVPVNVGGLQFPTGTVGIDDNGNPVNGSGQVLTPTGAINSAASPIGIVTPIAQAAAKIAALATGTATPTVYPAPAGTVLPAGAIGVNAQGYPVNAAGQILSATPIAGAGAAAGTSWFTNSTLMNGVPNWGVLAGAGVLLLALPAMFSAGRYKVSARK